MDIPVLTSSPVHVRRGDRIDDNGVLTSVAYLERRAGGLRIHLSNGRRYSQLSPLKVVKQVDRPPAGFEWSLILDGEKTHCIENVVLKDGEPLHLELCPLEWLPPEQMITWDDVVSSKLTLVCRVSGVFLEAWDLESSKLTGSFHPDSLAIVMAGVKAKRSPLSPEVSIDFRKRCIGSSLYLEACLDTETIPYVFANRMPSEEVFEAAMKHCKEDYRWFFISRVKRQSG